MCWQRSQALSACRDRVIRFWKLETGELLGFEKHPRTILIYFESTWVAPAESRVTSQLKRSEPWGVWFLACQIPTFICTHGCCGAIGKCFLVGLNSTSPRCSLLRGRTSSVCCLLVNWDLRREAGLDRMDKQIVSRKV